jgi:hypothetical protein
VEREDPGGRALRRRRAGDRRRDPRPPPGLRLVRHSRRRCCCSAAGPTTSSRPRRRCASTTRCAPPNPAARVSLQLGDLGHARGSNKANADHAFNDAGSAFFDAYLRGAGSPPAPGRVTAFTQTCPQAAAAGGPFGAASWPALHPGAVLFGAGRRPDRQLRGGNPGDSQAYDPISGGGDACRSSAKESAAGTAYYDAPRRPATRCSAGRRSAPRSPPAAPTASSPRGCGTSRPGGSQVLVTRGIYRLLDNQSGKLTFQLNGNGYRFAKGHVPRLELLGRDAPYYRASNGSFSVAGLEAPGRAAGRRAPRLGARRRLTAPCAAAARPQAPPLKITSARYRRPASLRVPGQPDPPQGRLEAPRLPRQGHDQREARQAHAAQAPVAIRHKTCRFSKKLKVRTKAKR